MWSVVRPASLTVAQPRRPPGRQMDHPAACRLLWCSSPFFSTDLSWALFWNTGVFFDRQAFAFLVLNRSPDLPLGLPAAGDRSPHRHARCFGGPGMVGARMDLQPRPGNCNAGWFLWRALRLPSVSPRRSSAGRRTPRRRRSRRSQGRLRGQPRRSSGPARPCLRRYQQGIRS